MKNLRFHLRQLREKVQYLFAVLYKRQYTVARSRLGTITTPDYAVKANPWGAFKIPARHRRQFRTRIWADGWAWQTPGRNYGVIGYPSITFYNDPLQICGIFRLGVAYRIRLRVERHRKYNLSFDLWIGTAPRFEWPKIVHEIMVWEDYRVAMPFGKYVATVDIQGHAYRVYSGYIDKSSEKLGVPGWQYTAFLRVDRARAGSLDLAAFLRHLVARNLLDADHYLLRAELGTEVYNANGAVELEKIFHELITYKS